VRYGSSAQYFFTGTQMLIQNLLDCENRQKSNELLVQGGAATTGAASASASAYLYLKLPHNSCRAEGKPLPFSSDLLVQPIVITVELLPTNSVFIVNNAGGASLATAPTSLAAATLQVKQEMLTDTSDLLARRVDMNSHAYTFPLMYFAQQEVQIPLVANPVAPNNTTQTVNLTGFRAGEVKAIVLWMTSNALSTPGSGAYNPNQWANFGSVQLTYNGEIFTRFDNGSATLWNLIEDSKSQGVDVANFPPLGAAVAATTTSPWVVCPFAQVNQPYDREMKLMHGKPILNAVVSLQLQPPADNTLYTLHAMYLYNASLLCSRGSAEYVF